MDRDVLQAFVDFLNQNHDKLTPKQQLNLLNSLGVSVATVKNPDDYCSMVQQRPSSSSSMHNHACKSDSNVSSFSAAAVSDQCNISNALKYEFKAQKFISKYSSKGQ